MEKALTIKEAAHILGISVNQLYRLTGDNKVPFFHIGAAIRFLPSQLEKFMLGEWTPKAPKRRPGRQIKLYPQKFTPETDPKLQ
jgi:excisionase family DNA binding protein